MKENSQNTPGQLSIPDHSNQDKIVSRDEHTEY